MEGLNKNITEGKTIELMTKKNTILRMITKKKGGKTKKLIFTEKYLLINIQINTINGYEANDEKKKQNNACEIRVKKSTEFLKI